MQTKSTLSCALCAVSLATLCLPAFAEKWVEVGTLQPIGVVLTVDTDSAIRKGDTATILVRPTNVVDPKSELLNADCKRRAVGTGGQSWSIDKDFVELRKTWPSAMLTKIWGHACG